MKISALTAALVLIVNVSLLLSNENQRSFQGLIIFISDTALEVKRGGSEMTFVLNENTAVISNNSAAVRGDIGLCQSVRVYYSDDENRTAVRVEILRPGYCAQ